ncbi:MAG: hypothetical protein QGI78_02120 [Phycisphaerales bacterium]|nr:hypothetical protein [Phycisphaerales bacterium]
MSTDRFGPFVWFVGLCGLLVCVGISVDQIGFFSVPVFVFGNTPLPLPLILPEVVVLIILLIATVLWWRFRYSSLKWGGKTKTIVLCCAFLLPVLYFTALFLIVFLRR